MSHGSPAALLVAGSIGLAGLGLGIELAGARSGHEPNMPGPTKRQRDDDRLTQNERGRRPTRSGASPPSRVEGEDDRCEQQRNLARHFGLQRLGNGAVIEIEVGDDRVGLRREPSIVERSLPPVCATQALRWSVVYQRVLDTPAGAEHAATVWDEILLASESLTPPPRAEAGD